MMTELTRDGRLVQAGSMGWHRLRQLPYYVAIPSLILLAWYAVDRLQLEPAYLVPSPGTVLLHTLPSQLRSGAILINSGDSIRRVFIGVALAACGGIPMGVSLGYWHGADKWTSALINAGRVLPPAALLPLAVIWFGIGDAPALFLIAFTCFWPILLNAISGVQGVERILRESALTMGASSRQVITTVLLPASLPHVVGGVRLAMGLGWSVVVTAELLAVRNGLGAYIWNARLFFAMDQVFVGIIVIGLIGYALDLGLRSLEPRLFAWRRGTSSL